MLNLTGRILNNKYRLVRELGSGGFAVVYLAKHLYLETQVAIKVLNLASGDIQNFLREAQTIARLDHPHIVPVTDCDIDGNVPYLVMKYAPNGTLRQRHPKGTRVALPFVVMYVKQIASALSYAHAQQMIHRDVKPENILLGPNDELWLSDFGVALVMRTTMLLQPQIPFGTPCYMAPEQFGPGFLPAGGKLSPAIDQYALGVTVYEWLCGFYPFDMSNGYADVSQMPPSLCARIPTLPSAVEQVVMKALARRPEQRFASVAEFANAFEQAANGQPVSKHAAPLVLPGNAHGTRDASLLTERTLLPPSPIAPPSIAANKLATTVKAKTYIAKPPVPPVTTPPIGPRDPQRRKMFGYVAMATLAVLGGGVAAWVSAPHGPGKTASITPTPTPTPVPRKSTPLVLYKSSQKQVFTAAWSLDDAVIASSGGNTDTRLGDNEVYLWKARTKEPVFTYSGHSHLVRMAAWSPDGRLIASASEDKTVQVWDATSNPGNAPITTYIGHNDKVMAVSWSSNGKLIASISLDQMAMVWDAFTGEATRAYTDTAGASGKSSIACISWSPNGKLIASTVNDTTVALWEPLSGSTVRHFSGDAPVGALSWSPDAKYLAIGYYNLDDGVKIYDITSNKLIQKISGKYNEQVYSLSWSSDSKFLAIGCGNEIHIWNAATQKLALIYQGHKGAVMSVRWSHSGKYVLSCGFDQTVQIWTPSPR
jgi:serine/threonine protein kinase